MSEGLAFVCDGRGLVRRVLRDDLDLLASGDAPGSFAAILESGSIAKWFRLLAEVGERGSAHGWELQTRDEISLTLAAATQGDDLVVVAAPNVEALSPVLGDLAAIGSEYAELLRRMQDLRSRGPSEEARWARFTEVTNEMAAMQRELARKNRELQRLDAEKNQLLGMVAHDLRTPIQTILVASEALAAQPVEGVPGRLISAMRSAAAYMKALVNDALDYAAIESGKVELEREEADLVDLVRQVVDLHEISA